MEEDRKNKIIIADSSGKNYSVDASVIISCESAKDYLAITLENEFAEHADITGGQCTLKSTMKCFIEHFAEYGFLQIHESVSINLNQVLIHEWKKEKTNRFILVTMNNKKTFRVAKERKEEFLEGIKKVTDFTFPEPPKKPGNSPPTITSSENHTPSAD